MIKCSHRCMVSKPITACSVTRWVSTPHGMKCPQRTKAVSAARPLERGLKNYFPHVLQGLQDKDTPIFCDFLRRWPTLKAVQLARRSTLESFFRGHHVRSPEVIARRIQAIRAALPLTTDEG